LCLCLKIEILISEELKEISLEVKDFLTEVKSWNYKRSVFDWKISKS